MSLRRVAKAVVFGVALLVAVPFIALVWLEKTLLKTEGVFTSFCHLFALLPGPIGSQLRGAYYFGTLDACSWEVHVGFGSVFTHRGARVARNVSLGMYCVIGHASIEENVRLASRISIPSGKRQHLDDSGRLTSGTFFERVTVGAGSWVGEGAIILADVGPNCIVSAGAVVVNEIGPTNLIGGNPAKVLKPVVVAAEAEKVS